MNIREINNNDVDALNAAFEKTPIHSRDGNRAAALAAYKATHAITVADDGTILTSYSGVQQPLASALSAWSRTEQGEQFSDRRSLPREEKAKGGIRSKSELKTLSEKAAFIATYGATAYEQLPSVYLAPSEVHTRQDFYKLSTSDKSALIKANPRILEELPDARFIDKEGMEQIAGGRVNRAALAKDKATRPNQK